jgi:hypothetical protein
LLNRRKSRPLLEQLENRLCMATGAYTYSLVAATGSPVNAPGGPGILKNISLASINDSGNVAFLGTANGYNGVYEATFSNGNWSLSDLSVSSSQNYTYPQIDNNGEVIAEDHELDITTSDINTYIRLWYPDATKTDLEQGSSANGDLFVVPTISPDGKRYAYLDDVSHTFKLFIQGASVHQFPANSSGLQPMIANNGAVVVRDGSTTTSPIRLFQLGQTPVTIADPAYFSSIGNNPGIDAAGSVVTFTGTLFDAASLNAANALSISKAQILSPGYSLQVNQLTPGPGVFASVPIDDPSGSPADRVVIRLAGVSGSGYLNPGETWTGTTDVGPFSAFPDARSVPTSNLFFSSSTHVLGLGTINVAFMANDTTSNANQGLYQNDITIRSGVAAVDNPIEVVNSGETITGVGQITAVNDYFPMNAYGQVVFVANTAGGQAVVQANPYTYLPPSVTNPQLYDAYKPSQIRTAYGIDQIPKFTGPNGLQVTPDGTGQTIAIVDAYNDPNIIGDLAQFDSAMGLPAPPSFQVYNQTGTNITSLIGTSGQNGVPQTDPNNVWEGEEVLDVEWAHAIAPGAPIILVEANSDSSADLDNAAVVWAASPASGASVVSLSFGSPESSNDTKNPAISDYMPRVGVTLLASTGDEGAPGGHPAFSPNVVAVGGTTLYLNSDNSYLSETTWGEGGGGVSQQEKQPTYQNGIVTQYSAAQRVTPDVSFIGDQRTGVLIYNSYNKNSDFWEVTGGTSLSAPCWAGLIAIANQGRVLLGKAPLSGANETLPALYSLPAADFHDVTTGNNGQYTLTTTNQAQYSAGPGYDPATGLGSPVANLLIPDLVAYTGDIWTGKGSDNLWSDPANWSGNSAPVAGADLLFPSGALQEASVNDLGLAFNSITTAGTYSFSGNALTTNSLNVKSGSLELDCSTTVSQAATVSAGASLTVDSGKTLDIQISMLLAATSSLTVQGTVTVDLLATVNDQGTVTVAAAGTLTDQGAVKVASGGTLNDQGTVTVAAGGALDDQGTVTVASGGELSDPGTVTVAAGETLKDSGTVTVTGALQVTGTFEEANGGVLNDQGSVTVAPSTGNLLGGGTVAVYSGASLDDQGTVDVTNQFIVAGTMNVESGALLFVETTGTLGITGTVTVVSGGTLTDQGTVTVPSGGILTDEGTATVSPSGALTVDGTVSVASGAKLDNQGTVKFEGSATLDDSGSVTVDSGVQLSLLANSTVEASGTLTVRGTVTVGAVDTLTIKGMVTVASGGTLDDLGTVSVVSGGSLDDQGTVTVETAATLADSGTVTVATGAHLDLFGKVTVDGTLDDQGAVMVGSTSALHILGPGDVQVESAATLDINGAVAVEIGATLDVSGTLTVEQLGLLDDKGSLNVAVAGTLDDLGLTANAITVEAGASLGVSGQLIVEKNAFLDIKGTVEIHAGGSLNNAAYAIDQGTVTVEATGLLSDQDAITVAAGATLDVLGQLTEGVGGLTDVFGTLIIETSGKLDIFGTVITEIGATYTPLGTVIIEPGGTLKNLGQAQQPAIVVSTNSLNLGTTTAGTAGAAQSFTVSGSNLTADVILTAPSGVELSDNGGTNYSSTLDLVESGGTVGTTTVLARNTAGAPVGPVSGKIAADSTGATEQDIAVTGNVNTFTVTVISGSGTYGGTVTLTATLTASGSGVANELVAFTFINGTTITPLGSATTNANGLATLTGVSLAGLGAGTYVGYVSASFAGDTNYGASSGSGDLTVAKALLKITASDRTKTYGDTVTFAGTEFTPSGLVNSDSVNSVSLSSTGAGATATVGDYAIVASAAQGTGLGNYTISYVDGKLSVSPRALTITADAKTKTYGDPDPALTYQVTSGNLVNGDSFTGALTRVAGENVGTYAVQQGTLTLSSNYALTYAGANLQITARPITVTADAKTKVYGAPDPALTYQITSGNLVNGDSFSGALTRVAGENVGTYAIQQGTLALSSNYALTYAGAKLTIGQRSVTVTADAKTKTYGATDPALTYQITSGNLVNGDSFSGALTRLAGENVGTYAITQGTLALSSNYALTYVGANLTINKANPQVTVAGGTFNYDGQAHPATGTVTGVFNENLGTPTFAYYAGTNTSGTPLASAPVEAGTYTVVASFAGNNNYNSASKTVTITIVRGTVQSGQTATIGFWAHSNGLNLITALGIDKSGNSLAGQWLAAQFPNLFGSLSKATPKDVWNYNVSLFNTTNPPKLEAQVMATALSAYVTDASLNSTKPGQTTATKYGFNLSLGALGACTWNVGSGGSPLGLNNYKLYTVMQILKAADSKAVKGQLFSTGLTSRSLVNAVFDSVNNFGDISSP